MIIFLHGTDTYRLTRKINEIKDKFIREVDPQRLNLEILEGEVKPQQLKQALLAAPFLAKRRMVILKNILSSSKSEDVEKVMEDFMEQTASESGDTIVVIFEQDQKSPPKIIAKLKKKAIVQEFGELKPIELQSYIIQEARSRGAIINSVEADYLGRLTGPDLWRLGGELDKLSAASQGQAISKILIDQLVPGRHEDNIFGLVDAVAERNKPRAFKLMSDFFAMGDKPLQLFPMILRQFRILLQIKDWQSNDPRLTGDAIASAMGIHPFVAKKSLGQAQRFTLVQLKEIYAMLVTLDKRLKSSYADSEMLMELFVAKL